MSLRNKKNGFTLIELLVVVGMIVVLSTVTLISLNSARIKTRNAERVSSVKTLTTAFSLSLASNNPLPDTSSISNGWACISNTCYGNLSAYLPNTSVDAFLNPNLPQKPIDSPGGRNGGGFLYRNPATYFGITGAYLFYALEPNGSVVTACNPGKLINSTSTRWSCVLQIDN